jgi:hypothetical protein
MRGGTADASASVDAAAAIDGGAGEVDATPQARTSIYVDDVTTFAVPRLTHTKIPYTTEISDELGEYDPGTSRFTPSFPGDYQVCAALHKAPYLPTLALNVFKNDDAATRSLFGFNRWVVTGCTTVRLVAGDFIDVRIYQDGEGSYTFEPNATWAWLTIHRVDASAFAYTDATFTAENAVFTTVRYGHEVFDDGGELDPSTSRFTAAAAGDVQVCASAAGSTYYPFELEAFIDGARVRGIGAGEAVGPGCHTLRLASGAILDVRATQSTGSQVTYAGDGTASWVSLAKRDLEVVATVGATFTVPTATFTRIPYSTEVLDDGGAYDPANARFTAPVAGDYEMCASLSKTSEVAFFFELHAYKNGAAEKGFALGIPRMSGCRVIRLAAGDTLEAYVNQPSGQTMTIEANPGWSYLTISKL